MEKLDPPKVARDLPGHQSLATISVYVMTERDNRSRGTVQGAMPVLKADRGMLKIGYNEK